MIREKTGRSPTKTTQVAEVGDNLARILERILDGNHNEIIRRLDKMDQEEQLLNEKLTELGTASAKGFTDITTAVTAAADRVIAKLQASDLDLSEEIKAVEDMKTATSEGAALAVSKLAEIAPDNVPAPPVVTEPDPNA